MFGLIPAAGLGPAQTVRLSIFFFQTPICPGSLILPPTSSVVNNNPSAFAEAYWQINSLRVYTPDQQD